MSTAEDEIQKLLEWIHQLKPVSKETGIPFPRAMRHVQQNCEPICQQLSMVLPLSSSTRISVHKEKQVILQVEVDQLSFELLSANSTPDLSMSMRVALAKILEEMKANQKVKIRSFTTSLDESLRVGGFVDTVKRFLNGFFSGGVSSVENGVEDE